MSGDGAPDTRPFDCHDLRVAVVASTWHETVMDGLIDGATRALKAHQVEAPVVVRVPGSFELPVVASALAGQGYDAIIALGVVIRGGTPHFDYVCSSATDGLNRVALDRAGLEGSREDKGYESAQAALLTAQTLRKIREPQALG